MNIIYHKLKLRGNIPKYATVYENGENVLHQCVMHNDLEMCDKIVGHGGNIEEIYSKLGLSAIQMSAFYGYDNILAFLLGSHPISVDLYCLRGCRYVFDFEPLKAYTHFFGKTICAYCNEVIIDSSIPFSCCQEMATDIIIRMIDTIVNYGSFSLVQWKLIFYTTMYLFNWKDSASALKLITFMTRETDIDFRLVEHLCMRYYLDFDYTCQIIELLLTVPKSKIRNVF